MSRKSGQDQSSWKMPSIQVFNVGYSSFRLKNVEAIHDALIWFYNGNVDESSGIESGLGKHPLFSSAGMLQDLLLRKENNYRFSCIIFIDLKDIFDSGEELDEESVEDFGEVKISEQSPYDKAIAAELEDIEVTKSFGKKILRVIQRLILQNAIIACQGSLCAVFIKLYKSIYNMDPDIVSELWLLYPNIPAELFDTHLVDNEGGTIEIYKNLKMKFIFKNRKKKRFGMLHHVFPCHEKFIFSDPINWFHILAHFRDSPPYHEEDAKEHSYDPECMNEMGETLFMSSMEIEMNPFSKQYERNCFDITEDLMEMEELQTESSLTNIDFSKLERHIGALVLRGNRCILVRSLDNEWDGMRIPYVPYDEEDAKIESPHEAAIRAVEEFADVDPSEVTVLPFIEPVVINAANNEPIAVELYVLYAVNPPPSGVSPEEMDEEDEEDLYDWYTYDSAIRRLNDEPSILGTKAIASALIQASKEGLLKNKWGGIFGQEAQLN